MPVSSFLPAERRFFRTLAGLFVLVFLLLMLGLFTSTAEAVRLERPNATLIVGTDTLDASPELKAVIAAWNPSEPRAYCVTSFAEWTGWLYLRHVEDAGSTGCEGSAMGLAQIPVCPTPEQLAEVPPAILIQCGPGVFRRNKAPGETNGQPPLPLTPGTRIA